MFAWVWKNGEQNGGKWVGCTGSGSTVKFELESGRDRFVLVRAHKDTTTPDWNMQGDKAGRIYNKTADITVISGLSTYNANFVEYTPSGGSSGGGGSGGNTQPTNNKISVTADSWTWDGDVKVFAWVWKDGETNSGKWIGCTKSGNAAEFELESGKNRFLLVRCYKTTTTPDWDMQGDKPGRIYSKTPDIKVIPGRKVYSTKFNDHTPTGGSSGGGGSGGNTQPTNNKITVNVDSWIWNDNAKVFAWVWKNGEQNGGKWVSCTRSGSAAKFDLEPGRDRFLLVRTHKGTVQPNWTTGGDNPGRIYNKTADITVKANQTTYSVSFVEYTPSGGGSGGGGSGGNTQPTNTKITVNVDSWIWNDNAKVFAWIWKNGEQNGGKWVSCTRSGSTAKFDLESGRDRFLLVRAHKSTAQPNWTTGGDNPGRIYNKTADITVKANQTTYSVSFVEYTPSGSGSGGGGSGGNTQPTNTKITVNIPSSQSWIWNNSAKVFAWVWKGSAAGSWKPCTGSGRTVKFDLPAGCDHFKLVRVPGSTSTPDWGSVWNQTGDITVNSGQTSYDVTFN